MILGFHRDEDCESLSVVSSVTVAMVRLSCCRMESKEKREEGDDGGHLSFCQFKGLRSSLQKLFHVEEQTSAELHGSGFLLGHHHRAMR